MSSSGGTDSSKPGSGKGGFVPPSTGDLDAILDQYEFLDLLGRGGMGAVYKARQKSLDRLVAIKILPPHLTSDAEEQGFHFAERFQREAKAMAKLSHPHIVGVHDFGQARDGQFYFVMEYIEGTDLHALIKGGQLTTAHVAGWMSQICEALQYAHDKGIVHRDIKPANIMITREGQVKVADFGLAKLGDAAEQTKLTMTNMAMGTPDYVAPEVLETGVEVDHRADLYALGVMLYEMLTGRVPRGNWKAASSQVAGLDPRYDELIERAMDSDRESRIQRASEIGATLYRIATTPAAPPAPRRTLVTGEAATPSPREHTRPQKPAGSSSSVREKAPASDKSTAGLIGGIVAACVALGLGGFFWIKPKLFPPPPEPSPAPVANALQPTPSPAPPVAPPASPAKADPPAAPKSPTPPADSKPAPAPAVAALPETIDTAPWTDAIDLLPYIDLGLDTLEPGWKRDGTALFTEKQAHAMLKLPVVAPEEYDLRLLVTRTAPGQSIGLILTRQEREFNWVGGAYGNGMFAFGGGRGDRLYANSRGEAKKQAQPCFEEGRTYQVQVSVRNTGAAAYVDGQWVTRLPADLDEMRLPDDSPMAGLGQLGLSTYQASFRVDALQLREVTGQAKLLREAPAPATIPAMTKASAPTPPATAPAPTDPVSLKLAELEKAYLAAYATQVAPKHDAAIAALNTSYTGRLDRDIATASQSGKLDLALALRDELTQVKTHGTVPDEDAADLSEALKPLRATYRTTLKTLLTQRDQAAAPLHAAYDRTLAAYQDELTKAQQLDQAARVKAVRDQAATQRESKPAPTTATGAAAAVPAPPVVGQKSTPLPPPPVAPPLTADKILPPLPKPSPDDITALVNWILDDRKGSVFLAEGPLRREFKQGEPLPRGNLKVVGIYIYEFLNDEPSRKFLDLLGSLPDLESLQIVRHSSVFPIVSLRGLTKLKSLTLGLGKFDDSGFAHLSGLTALTKVDFGSISGFTGTGLGYLGEDITDLQLSGCPHLSAEGLAYLSRFRKLNSLDIYNSKEFTDEALRPLAGLPELETLNVRNTPIDGSFLAFLPNNSKLKTLDLSENTKFQPQHLMQVGKLKQLETLLLPPLDPSPEAMASIAALGNLKTIQFFAPFTGESLVGVKGFRSLGRIDLNVTPITDAGWAAIAESMPNLQTLEYERQASMKGPISAAAMGEHLGKLRSLANVSATHDGMTDEWMPAIAKLKNVRSLSLQGAGITDAGLVALQDMEITNLIIRQTNITDAAIPTLKRFPALRTGEFHQTKITDPVRAEFDQFLKARAN